MFRRQGNNRNQNFKDRFLKLLPEEFSETDIADAPKINKSIEEDSLDSKEEMETSAKIKKNIADEIMEDNELRLLIKSIVVFYDYCNDMQPIDKTQSSGEECERLKEEGIQIAKKLASGLASILIAKNHRDTQHSDKAQKAINIKFNHIFDITEKPFKKREFKIENDNLFIAGLKSIANFFVRWGEKHLYLDSSRQSRVQKIKEDLHKYRVKIDPEYQQRVDKEFLKSLADAGLLPAEEEATQLKPPGA